jgi:hypothetical protein
MHLAKTMRRKSGIIIEPNTYRRIRIIIANTYSIRQKNRDNSKKKYAKVPYFFLT